MRVRRRYTQWEAIENNVFDVAVIGGGINGACLYHHLCARGLSVLLVDKGDFACGTSQASAMMIWGGLLYLRHGDLLTVRRLCTSRDRMVRGMSAWIKPHRFRYVPVNGRRRHAAMVHAVLHFYWLLGGGRRRSPRREPDFPERAFLKHDGFGASLTYEEACVEPSDARFVLHWLFGHQNGGQAALNYCALEAGAFDRGSHVWRLDVKDSLIDKRVCARARWVINAAGVWADRINDRIGIVSPIRHLLSKGVFIALKRDSRHHVPLILDTHDRRDRMSLIPWGPVSLWGPTETAVDTIERGYSVQPKDVRFLLDELNRHLATPVGPGDIIAFRCGIRPLAVDASSRNGADSLSLSRRHRIHRDADLPWISLYGGKFTNCVPVAREVVRLLTRALPRTRVAKSVPTRTLPDPIWDSYPTVNEPMHAARWCADWEMCWTLEDYLRRRTNVSQWVSRGGLGEHDEHLPRMIQLAEAICGDENDAARAMVTAYRGTVSESFDRIIAGC